MAISVMVLFVIITSLVIFPFSVVVVVAVARIVVVSRFVVVVMGGSFIIEFPLELIAFDLSVL